MNTITVYFVEQKRPGNVAEHWGRISSPHLTHSAAAEFASLMDKPCGGCSPPELRVVERTYQGVER